MQEATYSMTQQAMGENPGDASLLVRFFQHAVKDDVASLEAGHPVFINADYIDIRVPGEKNTSVVRKARSKDKQRFHKHWAAYQARVGDESEVIGMPLSEWAGVTRADVENLSYMNIKSVEQLASMTDNACSRIMGGQNLKAKAQAFLKVSEANVDAAKFEDLASENQALAAKLAEMEAKLEAMNAAEED